MDIIKNIRIKNGYSQREFAHKTALSFRGIQLLEKPNHNWRITTIHKVANTLNLPASGIELMIKYFLEQNSNSIMICSIRIIADGNDSWPLHLFNFVDIFRKNPDITMIKSAPHETLNENIKALLASVVEALCNELHITVPLWCNGISSLVSPWFVSGIENLKPMALVESPTYFRKRNIFVLENFLNRV